MKSHLHPSNCIGIRQFAEQHGRQDLVHKVDQYIRDNFIDVVQSDEYSSMTASYLTELVASPDVNVTNECEVYEAIMKWVRYDVTLRRSHLTDLIGHVKLPLIDAKYLNEIAQDELIKTNLKCRDYLDEAKNFQLAEAQILPEQKVSEKMRARKSCAGKLHTVTRRAMCG